MNGASKIGSKRREMGGGRGAGQGAVLNVTNSLTRQMRKCNSIITQEERDLSNRENSQSSFPRKIDLFYIQINNHRCRDQTESLLGLNCINCPVQPNYIQQLKTVGLLQWQQYLANMLENTVLTYQQEFTNENNLKPNNHDSIHCKLAETAKYFMVRIPWVSYMSVHTPGSLFLGNIFRVTYNRTVRYLSVTAP